MSFLFTVIARNTDGLLLYGSMDQTSSELDEFHQRAKQIISSLRSTDPSQCSLSCTNYQFHYVISSNVCYLVLTHVSFQRSLAFSYLEEVKQAFEKTYGPRVSTASQSYEFIAFDTLHSSIKRQYSDIHASSNVQKARQNLEEVRRIMTKNIDELLERGDKFDYLKAQTTSLSESARKYKAQSIKVWRHLLVQKLTPIVGFVLVISTFWFIKKLRR
ncbi:hypothetical protein P9112_005700 [Eukaryota sp. TZLM1-RC]